VAVPEAGKEVACGNLVDLEPLQPQCQVSGSSSDSELFQSLDAGVDSTLLAPLCPQQPPPPGQ